MNSRGSIFDFLLVEEVLIDKVGFLSVDANLAFSVLFGAGLTRATGACIPGVLIGNDPIVCPTGFFDGLKSGWNVNSDKSDSSFAFACDIVFGCGFLSKTDSSNVSDSGCSFKAFIAPTVLNGNATGLNAPDKDVDDLDAIANDDALDFWMSLRILACCSNSACFDNLKASSNSESSCDIFSQIEISFWKSLKS
jgi:hypothetical protein